MDKNVLIQYVEMKEEIKDLRRRIHENERELAKLENMIVTDSVTRGKRGKKPLGTVKITGRPTAAIALKQKLLKKRNDRLTALEAELLELTNQAEEYIETINPKQLQDDFIDFVRRAQSKYKVYEAYCDSAEQTLISGLETACIQEHVVIDIKNAIKGPINDRIAFYNSLIAQHRWKIMKHCTHVIAAFEEAVYDEKKKNMDVRLDDGEMNVDSLDSTEYSTESIQDEIMYIAA